MGIYSKLSKEQELLNRIEDLRTNNPNFAKAIEEAFPEIIDNSPFIKTESILFMKTSYPRNIYQLFFDYKDNLYKIRNLKTNVLWDSTTKATNSESIEDKYLSEYDLDRLLKRSGISLKYIKFIKGADLTKLHQNLFL